MKKLVKFKPSELIVKMMHAPQVYMDSFKNDNNDWDEKAREFDKAKRKVEAIQQDTRQKTLDEVKEIVEKIKSNWLLKESFDGVDSLNDLLEELKKLN